MLFAQPVECVLDKADVRAALDELAARKLVGDELAPEAFSRFIGIELSLLVGSSTSETSGG